LGNINLAISDFKKALGLRPIWLHLGFLDVRQRYRRSVLGPWWITISMIIFIGAMSLVFSKLFGQSLSEYIKFFAVGFLLWTFISTCVNESAEIFRSNSGFIKQINLPYNIYVLRFITKNIIILAHNFVVYFLIAGVLRFNPGWVSLWAIPGLLVVFLNTYWICLLIALISTRYRDMVPIINSTVQILFFVTPISWMPKLLEGHSFILKLNPLVYFLDIVRKPLLGEMPSAIAYTVTLSMALIGMALTLSFFSQKRSRIPFWID
jgi:lipopolysaccharide transport system permease protein